MSGLRREQGDRQVVSKSRTFSICGEQSHETPVHCGLSHPTPIGSLYLGIAAAHPGGGVATLAPSRPSRRTGRRVRVGPRAAGPSGLRRSTSFTERAVLTAGTNRRLTGLPPPLLGIWDV